MFLGFLFCFFLTSAPFVDIQVIICNVRHENQKNKRGRVKTHPQFKSNIL